VSALIINVKWLAVCDSHFKIMSHVYRKYSVSKNRTATINMT